MIRNYFKIATRTLMKNKLFSVINIFGLALSMSVCLLVLLRIKDQVGYDKFHPHPNRTYRVITELTNKEGNKFRFATSPLPFLNKLTHEYNFVESAVRLYLPGNHEVSLEKKNLRVSKVFADSSFFAVFGFALQEGSHHTALQFPNSVVLSNETAKRFFGDKDPMGQLLVFKDWGNFQVTGIMNVPRGKSHIEYDVLLSMSSVPELEKSGKLNPLLDKWDNVNNSYTYLTTRKGITKKQVNLAVEKISGELMKQSNVTGKEKLAFEAQPLNKIILGEELISSIGRTGSRGKVIAEIVIAFIILLSACFNYTNLSIARSLNRGKEVGIRKVSGASRIHIFLQFMIESLLVSLLSLGLAYVLLQLIIDYAPFGPEMIPEGFSFDRSLFGWFLIFTFFAGLLAGGLPAWALSSFKPVQVLKNLRSVKLFGGNIFRKGLIVTQFSLSLVIIIFTQLFSRQFAYMRNTDPGFNQDNMLSLSLQGEDYKLLAAEIGRLSQVEMVSASSDNLGRSASGIALVKNAPGDQSMQMPYYDVDENFIATMQLQLTAGNNFTGNNSNYEQFVLINENARHTLKFKSDAEAINKTVWIDDSTQVQIAGVVKDFYFRGTDAPIIPLIFRNREKKFNILNIKTKNSSKEVAAAIAATWKKFNPEQTPQYEWLKEKYDGRLGGGSTFSMLGFLALIALTLACLGLLGIVTYTIETRRKEIGIRKVMGANVSTIIRMLSTGFLKLVLIAGCIALPISYIMGYLFLNIFANRISLGITVQLFSLLGLLFIALLTIGSQIFRVAVANPVDALRNE